MAESRRKPPAGAAVLRPELTSSIRDAVLAELAECGYARLSMEGVARRAGVGKSALYRRWPSKQEMVVAAVAELSVPMAKVPGTGSLRGDVLAVLRAVAEWLAEPRIGGILSDLVAEAGRTPALARALAVSVGDPRRAHGAALLERAVERGELAADVDRELALDLLGALVYWRMVVRRAPVEEGYFERAADAVLRALGAVPAGAAADPPETAPSRFGDGTSPDDLSL
ncbi:TetR/AcrR family transcriptional regulator [Allostreptomyces psammosilenae]|uniref:AcrR family transcriptional regulator n=1 Tax=Allostreptomyces psammosilenae TaxID=1892865 RepID=A0A853A0S4_9ACTN|nr:TetR/AcrR family transcriptional regulator [Allostreptomyces psammosilenae]NYI08213.1 AcrR family transcriptional regulator [Allostreptomyces psammosilenae]